MQYYRGVKKIGCWVEADTYVKMAFLVKQVKWQTFGSFLVFLVILQAQQKKLYLAASLSLANNLHTGDFLPARLRQLQITPPHT